MSTTKRIHRAMLGVAIATLALGALATPPPAHADDAAKAACGRKAKQAGVKGKDAVAAYVADCVANMKGPTKKHAGTHKAKKPRK